MRKAIIILSLLFALPAHAVELNGWTYNVLKPPASYVVRDYPGHLIVKSVSAAELAAFCDVPTGHDIFGCTTPSSIVCIIRIRDDLSPDDWVEVYLHEYAHCNGWPSDHPLDVAGR